MASAGTRGGHPLRTPSGISPQGTYFTVGGRRCPGRRCALLSSGHRVPRMPFRLCPRTPTRVFRWCLNAIRYLNVNSKMTTYDQCAPLNIVLYDCASLERAATATRGARTQLRRRGTLPLIAFISTCACAVPPWYAAQFRAVCARHLDLWAA